MTDEKLQKSLSATSLDGYGNYGSVSLQSSATFMLHNHLSNFGPPTSTWISSVYVMGRVVTANILLTSMDFEGFAIHSPSEIVVKLELSEEQKDYIHNRLEDFYHVTLRFPLTDEQINLLETTAANLEDSDLLLSLIKNGSVIDEEATDFYVWSREYGFRKN